MSSVVEHLIFYLAAASVLLTATVIYTFVTNPLRHVPGPWYTRLTSLVYHLAAFRGRQMQYVHSLHDRYGPVVRVMPAEVSFSEYQDFKTIHKMGSGFNKSAFYAKQDATLGVHPNLFNLRDTRLHGLRRKLFARVMSARYMHENWQDKTNSYVRAMVAGVKAEADRDGKTDVGKWFRLLAGDVSSHLSFGESFRNVERGQMAPYMQAIANLPNIALLSLVLPRWFFPVLEYLPLPDRLRNAHRMNNRIFSQGTLAVTNSKASTAENKRNIFAAAIAGAEKSDGSLTDEQIVSDAAAFIAAGTDTTAVTLFFATWAVLKNPQVQKELEAEVTAAGTLEDTVLEKLPVLNACLEETLRLYGVASGPLPRETPAPGATIHGTFLPAGTTVVAAAYLFHRDPKAFPDPDRWDHSRYLPDHPDYQLHKDHFGGFGAGSRVCIGVHLARMEMRKALAHFFTECRGARLAPAMQDAPITYETQHLFLSPAVPTLDIVLPSA